MGVKNNMRLSEQVKFWLFMTNEHLMMRSLTSSMTRGIHWYVPGPYRPVEGSRARSLSSNGPFAACHLLGLFEDEEDKTPRDGSSLETTDISTDSYMD